MTLEQEHVLGAVAAVDGQLAGALLAGDDVEVRREGGDGHHRLPYQVRPGHRQLQPLPAQRAAPSPPKGEPLHRPEGAPFIVQRGGPSPPKGGPLRRREGGRFIARSTPWCSPRAQGERYEIRAFHHAHEALKTVI